MADSILQRILSATDPSEKAAIVAESVLDSLPEETASVARYCAILHWFDDKIIEALLPEGTAISSQEVYAQLAMLPFVEGGPWGLAYHDLTRKGLINHYISMRPDLLTTGARIAAQVHQSYIKNEANAAEAFFCLTVTGQTDVAIQMRDTLLNFGATTKNWQYQSSILQMQREAETLPFVQPLFTYDVFISYSHDDEAWVTGTLLPALEKAGLAGLHRLPGL